MSGSPTISVIIPAYNEERHLARTLRSILRQTLSTDVYEIIVIDDCSEDNTARVLELFSNDVIMLRNEKRLGLPGSLNRGIKRARFVVIRETKIPAVLVEGSFLSHSYDAKIIATPEYRQQMASAIVLAINNYRRAVGAGAANPVASTEGGSAAEPRVRLNSDAVAPRDPATVPNSAAGKN